MSDRETLAVYARSAGDYAGKFDASDTPYLRAFIAALPPSGQVLDLGCGPGQTSVAMAKAGLHVTASDASEQMLALVPQHPNLTTKQATFDDLDDVAAFDGVYASFCLLHAPRAAFPGHLAAIARALKPGGLLYLGMKEGEGEGRDALGRFYTYYTRDGLVAHLADAGFCDIDATQTKGRGFAGTLDPMLVVAARRNTDG